MLGENNLFNIAALDALRLRSGLRCFAGCKAAYICVIMLNIGKLLMHSAESGGRSCEALGSGGLRFFQTFTGSATEEFI